jgi:hypothetical protein
MEGHSKHLHVTLCTRNYYGAVANIGLLLWQIWSFAMQRLPNTRYKYEPLLGND